MGFFKDVSKVFIKTSPVFPLVLAVTDEKKIDKVLDKTEEIVEKAAKNPNTALIPGGFAISLAQETKKAYDESLRKEGHTQGVHEGELMAAKKFASLLEQSDNMRIGTFALGCHIAKLGNNSDEKLGVIVDALGEPNNFVISEYVRSENSKILREKPSFKEICNRYLDSLNAEQLKSLDGFLKAIINADSISSAEKNFYQNEWTPYLERRI